MLLSIRLFYKPIVVLILILVDHSSQAQEESFPCGTGNSNLEYFYNTGLMDKLYVHSCGGNGMHMMASSYLKASGSAPEIIEDPDGMEPPNDSDYVEWTCKYNPGKIHDGDPNTAWVEGAEGQGIGEIIMIPCLDFQKPIQIWSGYGKSNVLFEKNSRPKLIDVRIFKARLQGASQYGSYYEKFETVFRKDIELEDKNGYQNLNLPKFSVEKYKTANDQEMDFTYFLGIRIMEVYPGSKWEDTCISEVRNVN